MVSTLAFEVSFQKFVPVVTVRLSFLISNKNAAEQSPYSSWFHHLILIFLRIPPQGYSILDAYTHTKMDVYVRAVCCTVSGVKSKIIKTNLWRTQRVKGWKGADVTATLDLLCLVSRWYTDPFKHFPGSNSQETIYIQFHCMHVPMDGCTGIK